MAKMAKMAGKTLLLSTLLSLFLVTGCENIEKKAEYPTKRPGSDEVIYNGKRDTIWGQDESLGKKLFGGEEEDEAGATGIGVNSFLWRATLDTISFMPISSADPFGGVILTDWYSPPESQNERYKMNLYILTRQLRSDGIRVSIFKEEKDYSGEWRTASVSGNTINDVENTILTRARELRVAQQTSLLDE